VSGPLALKELACPDELVARLSGKGLRRESATAKADCFARSAGALLDRGLSADAPVYALFVPGRIEVLGKHTDYAGGRSVVVAADRGFCVVASPREDRVMRIVAVAWRQQAEFEISPTLSPNVGHWSNYPMTVARRVARNFPLPLRGADIAFVSDLEPAAGMSSSSAMLIASFLVMERVNGLSRTDAYLDNIDSMEALAGYLGAIENGQSFGTLAGDKGVGTFGGSEDHTAILCCRPDLMSQYSYCPVRFERHIPVPNGCAFAVASSGVIAEKTGEAMGKYNRASRLASAIVEIWRKATGRDDANLAAAVAGKPEAARQMRDILARAKHPEFSSRELIDRFEHFFAESEEIIPAAGKALIDGRMEEFGTLVDRSQRGAEGLLGNQVPETVHLARSARELGAMAASAFGAGFGGSVWALVADDKAAEFLKEWSTNYLGAFPQREGAAAFFLTHASPAAFDLA